MTDSDNQKWVTQLKEGYSTEIDLYQRILDLSNRQFRMLSEGKQFEVTRILKEKGKLIGQIQDLDQKMVEAKSKWSRIESQIDSEQRQQVQAIADEVRNLLSSILERDEENELLFQHGIQSMAEQMQEIRKNQAAHEAYQNQKDQGGPRESVLFDQKE